ncbi:MAG: fructose-bisphosphate aldolase class I [Alphaproteobacteria bacterium]|nr:fructose-bisphosphate aldolase class I [Alphaproteobacteria bacterium]
MTAAALASTVRALVARGRGILAADESSATIQKRLSSIGVVSTEENRRAYRELLFTTPGIGEHISGVILYDETLRQKTRAGNPFVTVLNGAGVLPGIKADKGAKALALSPEEKVTEGLDGLRERLKEYLELGATFTKWRAVIEIGDGLPTSCAINVNAHALARFAALSQEAGLVPIVEPEVLMDGGHDIARCQAVTEATLQGVFAALFEQRVVLEHILLKPNMVVSGSDCPTQASPGEIAERTIATFRRTVPAAVPGIVFLSGGQSEEEATRNLNAINGIASPPWQLSFSYGRALQQSVLKAWSGKADNFAAAQKAFRHRARLNGLARDGGYAAELERSAV